jgi:TP53 regulating kinase-like protein
MKAQGAEASILEKNGILLKKRLPKKYRLTEIDEKLRVFRTRREHKILVKLRKAGLNVPKAKIVDKTTLELEFIKGHLVKEILEDKPELMQQITLQIALLHDQDYVHQDLTTSNMIFADKVYLIDFGLAFHSARFEDKAVDIHLLKQALESKHHTIQENMMKIFWKHYNPKHKLEIKQRFDKVELRGRHKAK